METIELFKKLPLSPGLQATIEKIEKLEKEGKLNEAFTENIASLAMIRISDAFLRYYLAKLCYKKGDTTTAKILFAKAIEHLRKEDSLEREVIDAIKKEMV